MKPVKWPSSSVAPSVDTMGMKETFLNDPIAYTLGGCSSSWLALPAARRGHRRADLRLVIFAVMAVKRFQRAQSLVAVV
jgi:hypothetical protein